MVDYKTAKCSLIIMSARLKGSRSIDLKITNNTISEFAAAAVDWISFDTEESD